MINEFKFGYNARAEHRGRATRRPASRTSRSTCSGTVANTGIAGQGSSSALASPGGLVRVNSAGNGRGAPYNPYSLTFADSLSRRSGNHFVKVGADVRMIRMTHRPAGRHHLHLSRT